MSTRRLARTCSCCAYLLLVTGCTSGGNPPMAPIGGKAEDLNIIIPWSDIALPQVAGPITAHITYGGKVYHADYGGDPTIFGSQGAALITDGGGTWRQSMGYSYIWGQWLRYDTERTRTITWGTTAVARFVPAGGGLPDREQLFVLCGTVVVLAKDGTGAPVVVKQGQYAVASGTVGGGISLTGPFTTPTSGTSNPTQDELDIMAFLDEVTETHPDPCNP